jgi:hypothetical protein
MSLEVALLGLRMRSDLSPQSAPKMRASGEYDDALGGRQSGLPQAYPFKRPRKPNRKPAGASAGAGLRAESAILRALPTRALVPNKDIARTQIRSLSDLTDNCRIT